MKNSKILKNRASGKALFLSEVLDTKNHCSYYYLKLSDSKSESTHKQ